MAKMAKTHELRFKKEFRQNQAKGGATSSAKADLARQALAFAGFVNVSLANKQTHSDEIYKAVTPEELQYTKEDWKWSPEKCASAMFDYGPQDDDELNMVLNKRAPGQMKLSREWRIWLQPHQGEPDWLEAARAARLIMRAHAKDHETEICELVGGHIKLLTDDELAEYEAIPDRSDEEEEDDVADEDGGAGGSDGSGAKENARGNKAAKPAKPAAAKKSAAKAKKRAAAPESSDEEADDDFEEEALKPKRKYVKKAAKEAAKEVELFFCVILL